LKLQKFIVQKQVMETLRMPVAPTTKSLADKLRERLAARIAELEKSRRTNLEMIEDCQRTIEGIDILLRELRPLLSGSSKSGGASGNGVTDRGRVPIAIRELLRRSPVGLKSGEIADALVKAGVTDKRGLVHTTLFNFKKHGKLRFEEKSGKYFVVND
jgi:hypothetical protein